MGGTIRRSWIAEVSGDAAPGTATVDITSTIYLPSLINKCLIWMQRLEDPGTQCTKATCFLIPVDNPVSRLVV